MNEQNREEWRKIIELAEKINHGEVVIKIQAGKVRMEEYTVKRKPGEWDQDDSLETKVF